MRDQRLKVAPWLMGLGIFCAGNALADGFYFGISGGVTSADVSKSDLDEVFGLLPGETSSLDDSDKGFGLQVGYRWGSHFAAEVGYVDLGNAVYEIRLDSPSLLVADARWQSDGPTASLLGILPLSERFDLYARAGLYFADTRLRLRAGTASFEPSASSNDLLFGIGGTWNINDSYSVRLEYQRFADVGDSDRSGEADVDLISVGLLFR